MSIGGVVVVRRGSVRAVGVRDGEGRTASWGLWALLECQRDACSGVRRRDAAFIFRGTAGRGSGRCLETGAKYVRAFWGTSSCTVLRKWGRSHSESSLRE